MANLQFIKINKFEEHNPRKDRKRHHWIRLDNTIAFSDDLEGMDPDQKWFWIYLLTQVSFRQQDNIELNIPYFEKYSGVSATKINKAIAHFTQRQLIQVVSEAVTNSESYESVVVTDRCPTDITDITDVTDVTDVTLRKKDFKTDIEKIYSDHYPRKEGKAGGMKTLVKEIKTEGDFLLFEKAIKNYKSKMESENTEPRYIKNFSTFANNWRDYVEIQINQIQPYATKPVRSTNRAQNTINNLKSQAQRVLEGKL